LRLALLAHPALLARLGHLPPRARMPQPGLPLFLPQVLQIVQPRKLAWRSGDSRPLVLIRTVRRGVLRRGRLVRLVRRRAAGSRSLVLARLSPPGPRLLAQPLLAQPFLAQPVLVLLAQPLLAQPFLVRLALLLPVPLGPLLVRLALLLPVPLGSLLVRLALLLPVPLGSLLVRLALLLPVPLGPLLVRLAQLLPVPLLAVAVPGRPQTRRRREVMAQAVTVGQVLQLQPAQRPALMPNRLWSCPASPAITSPGAS